MKSLTHTLESTGNYLRPEMVFVVFALLFGLILVFANAPFQAADEGAHFWRAYHVYQGDLISVRQDSVVGGQIPQAVAQAHRPYEYLIGHPECRVDKAILSEDLSRPFDSEKKVFIGLFFPGLYAPIVYFPQAMGIGIGRLCGLSALKIMYAGRITNLLCWIMMIAVAIRISPVFKWVFVLIALMPMNISQGASLSADGPTNAMALMLTSLILYAAFSRNIELKKWNLFFIVLLGILLSMSKQVYLPLVGLVLLIPNEKFSGWRKKGLFCGSVIVSAVIATGVWSMVIRNLYTPFNGANAPEQMSLLMKHPWVFPGIAVNSLLVHWRGLFFSFIGVIGFVDTWLPGWVYRTYPFILTAIALLDSGQGTPIRWLQRSWVVLLCIAVFLLIELSMYLTWTQPGEAIVVGVHGRYFLPLGVPLLLALFYNHKIKLPCRKWALPILVLVYSFAVLTVTCLTVYLRYYGPIL